MQHRSGIPKPFRFRLGGNLLRAWPAALPLLAPWAGLAAPGDQLWRFYADFGVTVVVPIDDLSGNGGKDALVGSADDTLYLVEGKGPKAGSQLWSAPFKATVSAAAALPDINGDGRPDVAGGDELGLIQALSGGSGEPLWKVLTFGTVLSLISAGDADGDGTADVAVGSENDSVYCFTGNPGALLGKSLWEFAIPTGKGRGAAKQAAGSGFATSSDLAAAGGKPVDRPTGANSLALVRKAGGSFGIAVGTSIDTIYFLAPADGTVKWKAGLPGDIWQVMAFPDQDGDGIEEVLAACGADMAYLLKGSDGTLLWSHPVSMGAVSLAVSGDMDGDGKADALIGDGGGLVHCVPGSAKGAGVKSAWTYDFGDTSTILSIAAMGDLDKDGRADCAVGTSSDLVAVLSGKGTKSWSADMGGEVAAVADLGDVDGNGYGDVGAGSAMGFVSALFGGGPATALAPMGAAGTGGAARPRTTDFRILFPRNPDAVASGRLFDAGGRTVRAPRPESAKRESKP